MSINSKELKAIYLSMFRIREVEETIANRYSEKEMRCPTHLSIGQEAVAAVYGHLISKLDYAVSTHRAHAHYLAKGGNLKSMIAEIYGKKTGCSNGNGGSMHLIDKEVSFMGSTAIVGGTIPVGVGLGLSIELKNENRISTVFIGDGATEEGVFYEAINFAVLRNLPVLFICENNLYSVYSGLNVRQPENRSIQSYVKSLGVEGDNGDGYNVEEIYTKMEIAINHVRKGSGPYFLELFTYRHREHCGPNFDDHLEYRSKEEYSMWNSRDPMSSIEAECLTFVSESELVEAKNKIKKEIEEAFKYAQNSPWPKYNDLNKYLYKETV